MKAAHAPPHDPRRRRRPGGRGHSGTRGRAGRRGGVRLLVGASAIVLVLTGCTSSSLKRPQPSTDAWGSAAQGSGPGQGGTGLLPPDGSQGAIAQTSTSVPPTKPAPAPAAATLSWLDGPIPQSGVMLETAAGKRWQGPVPGEFALLGEQQYRWFGSDGAMVGCASGGGCVGVDGDGNLAVVAERGGPRLVFEPQGRLVGRFSVEGEVLPVEPGTPTLADALREVGVDLAGLVNSATLAPPFAGGVTGDPHVITAGGVRLTTQDAGQFVARAGDPHHTVQLEFAPMAHRTDVSVVSAVAIGTGESVVTVDMTGTLTVDGMTKPRQPGFEQVDLPGGVAVGRWPADTRRVASVVVLWPDGGSVAMTTNPVLGMTVVAHLSPVAAAVGLFGAGGQRAGPDLLSRRGIAENTVAVVASWAVPGSERLFLAAPPQLAGFPAGTPAIDPGAAKVAARACGEQGMQHAEDVAACAFDVALTGDIGFVPGHVALAISAERAPVPPSWANRWPALFAGSVVGAPGLPADGRLGLTLAAATSQVYRLTLDRAGALKIAHRNGCRTGQSPPGMDQPAMRLFDMAGHAVSDRLALCGQAETGTLPAGVYNVVIAAGPDAAVPVHANITLP